MTITFVGHGYVGLVTAATFADLGNKVWVIGHTFEKIENLKKGILPIYEPGLEEIVKKNVLAKRLFFTLDYDKAIPESEVVFIAVGTPPKTTGEADLSVVFEVAEKIGKHIDGYTIIATKSTVPVGTNKEVKKIIESVKSKNVEFDIASCPEFLREGQAISDTLNPDRVVFGIESKKASDTMTELHRPIGGKRVISNIETAEMIKYASNAFLATKISFANTIAKISELTGADGPSVLQAVGLDSRIGSAFLSAGGGYGGSCFPKDVKALIAIAKKHGYDFRLLREVEEVNNEAIHSIVDKAKDMLGNTLMRKTVCILGLAFKPDTDDIRDAPSLLVIKALQELGAEIKAYDPIAMENAKIILKNVTFSINAQEAIKDSDILILMTEWNEFKNLDFKKLKKDMRSPLILDARNIFDPKLIQDLGFV